MTRSREPKRKPLGIKLDQARWASRCLMKEITKKKIKPYKSTLKTIRTNRTRETSKTLKIRCSRAAKLSCKGRGLSHPRPAAASA